MYNCDICGGSRDELESVYTGSDLWDLCEECYVEYRWIKASAELVFDTEIAIWIAGHKEQ